MEVYEKYENKKWIHKANLLWIVNGITRETILSEQPYPTCRKKKKELLRTTNYNLGKLVIVSTRAKNQESEITKQLNKG